VIKRRPPQTVNDRQEILQIKLIDFGQSKCLRTQQEFTCIPQPLTTPESEQTPTVAGSMLKFHGTSAAEGQACIEMRTNRYWTIQVGDLLSNQRDTITFAVKQADYFGLCTCIHQILFSEELSIVYEDQTAACHRKISIGELLVPRTVNTFSTQEIEYLNNLQRRKSWWIPRCTFRRQWQTPLWSALYLMLLNHDDIHSRAPLELLLRLLRSPDGLLTKKARSVEKLLDRIIAETGNLFG
jgi:hypothetical protein